MERPNPDVLARLILRLVPRPDREYVVGDLEEGYAERAAMRGRGRARLWLWRQAVKTLLAYLAPARWGGGWMRDARRAARTLWRSPGFAAASVTTLALGIGAVTATFTVFEQVVLRPLPVRDQDGIVVAWNHHTVRNVPHFPFVGEAYDRVEERVGSLAGVAGNQWKNPGDEIVEIGAGEEHVLAVTSVLGDYFGVLGVEPLLGRALRPEDDVTGAERVTVISFRAWTRHFGRSPEAVGSRVTLAGEAYRVVGVLPRGFDYPDGTDAWVSLRVQNPSWIELDLVGRLVPGASAQRVAEEIATLYTTVPELERPYAGADPVVKPLDEVVIGDLGATLLLLLAGAVLVLLVACVNVANLVEVRAAGREATVAVRRALGASRWRLVRESLVEAGWLGLLGGVGGAALAVFAVRYLVPLAPAGLMRMDEVTPPDALALLVSAGLTTAVIAVLAVLPVLRAEKVDPSLALRGAGRSTGGAGRRRGGIVIAQAALAVWSAAVGVLLLRSLLALEGLDLGFRADDLVLVQLEVPYPLFDVPADFADRLDRIQSRAAEHAAIEAATPILGAPLAGSGGVMFPPQLEGQSREEAGERNPMAAFEVVQPDHFRTLRQPILRGRALHAGDGDGAPTVVVVNEAAARLFWPGADPLGRRLTGPGFGEPQRWWTVVGVAANARYLDLLETQPVVYFPLRQVNAVPPSYLLVRSAAGTEAVLPAVRDAVASVDPAIRVKDASSLRARLDAPLARPRFAVLILGTLAGTTLLLAAVGVYGVMAAAVRARTAEIGVRLACGATPMSVRRLVLRHGMLLAAAGAAIGGAAVIAAGDRKSVV